MNVLIERTDAKVTAEKLNRPLKEIEKVLKEGLKVLKEHRKQNRAFPHRDEKIVTSWNGMMIGSLSIASKAFGRAEYLKFAHGVVEFIKNEIIHRDNEGKLGLWRSFFEGKSSEIEGFAEDYANIISGLIELHQVNFDSEYLNLAEELQNTLDNLYRDKAGGGYYDALNATDGLFRIKDDHDGVEPSANSLTALNCLKLNTLTGKKVYKERFKQILRLFTKRLDMEPQGMTTLISAIIMDSAKPTLLTLSRNGNFRVVLDSISGHFMPHLLIKMENESDGKFIGHLCKGHVCSKPVADAKILLKQVGI